GNIDASATNATDTSPGIWGSGGFVPVGTNAAGFAGSLDGAGYVIDNLTIKRRTTDFVGLIGYAGSGSSISNLGLVGGEVRGRNFVGGLVGVNAGTITRSYVTGAVTGDIRVGGLAGDNSTGGTIADAHATATVSGVLFVGGLVGLNFNDVMRSYATGSVTGSNSEIGGLVGRNVGIISQSYATGEVRGPSLVGGLVGRHEQGATITEAYATGAVTGSNSDIGGLVGYNLGSITQAYATGAVKGAFYVGGLVGQIGDGAVRQVYATGTVEGDSVVGGLAGYNQALVEDAYASGAVTGVGSVGGLVGWNNSGSISRSYWDIGTTLRSVGVGTGTSGTDATGLTTAQARSQGSYVGWDFGSVWYQAGDMRPILRSEAATPVGGVITIRNLNQLQLMGANLAGSYRLAGNIDASATNATDTSPGIWGSGGFVPVGTNPFEGGVAFTGSLDGAGNVITGLTINRPNTAHVGLIGYAGSGSSISNLGLVGGSVTGNAFVGGLVGENGG
ncbi:MAG: hypothetical protein O9272_01020, partial [Brevundimonas sp.]|nr:hypothetical protein [Brevundimonas sp.]